MVCGNISISSSKKINNGNNNNTVDGDNNDHDKVYIRMVMI